MKEAQIKVVLQHEAAATERQMEVSLISNVTYCIGPLPRDLVQMSGPVAWDLILKMLVAQKRYQYMEFRFAA